MSGIMWWIYIIWEYIWCYGWNQNRVFLRKKNTRIKIIKMWIVIGIRLEWDILILLVI